MNILQQVLKYIKQNNKKAVIAFSFICLLFFADCGKRKPPLPPVENIPQTVIVKGFQRGDKIYLSWVMPAYSSSNGKLSSVKSIDVYRLTEMLNTSQGISEEEFASRSTLIKTIDVSESDFGRKELTFIDTLSFAGQSAQIRYAVRFVNSNGQKASFSNFLLIEPTARIADSPTNLKADTRQDLIIINWLPPNQNIDGSKPVNILGFNIYRTEDSRSGTKLLNTSPLTANSYSDRNFTFENEYSYFVRTVSLSSTGEPIEGTESQTIRVVPKDIFPPNPPSALTIASSPTAISIFFATNLESDVAGYRVYRSQNQNITLSEWELITPLLLTTNTFQDNNVKSGERYFYYIVAVDKYNNVSQRSETVNEIVP